MSDNWVVQNLQNALDTWNSKLGEIWQLVTQTPETFKGGSIWNVILNIHGKKEIRIRWHKTKNIDSNIIKEIAYSLTQTDRDSDIKAVTNWKEYTDSKENIEKIVKESIDELLHKINILKEKNHGK